MLKKCYALYVMHIILIWLHIFSKQKLKYTFNSGNDISVSGGVFLEAGAPQVQSVGVAE